MSPIMTRLLTAFSKSDINIYYISENVRIFWWGVMRSGHMTLWNIVFCNIFITTMFIFVITYWSLIDTLMVEWFFWYSCQNRQQKSTPRFVDSLDHVTSQCFGLRGVYWGWLVKMPCTKVSCLSCRRWGMLGADWLALTVNGTRLWM